MLTILGKIPILLEPVVVSYRELVLASKINNVSAMIKLAAINKTVNDALHIAVERTDKYLFI